MRVQELFESLSAVEGRYQAGLITELEAVLEAESCLAEGKAALLQRAREAKQQANEVIVVLSTDPERVYK
jgi:outer membrane protein TolC